MVILFMPAVDQEGGEDDCRQLHLRGYVGLRLVYTLQGGRGAMNI